LIEETFEERPQKPKPKDIGKPRLKKRAPEPATLMEKKKPVKLARKLVLVEATEAQDEDVPEEAEEVIIIKPAAKKVKKPTKPKLVIMDE
jgi:hypothetical protein